MGSRPARRLRPSRRPAPPPARAPRPPDPLAVRRRQESLEAHLDNQELERRRRAAAAEVEAALADAFDPPPAPLAPIRPLPTSPILELPVRRVVTSTPLAVLVEAWGLLIWVPRSAIFDPDDPVLSLADGGQFQVSSSWAYRVGLPPLAARSTT